MTTTVELTLNFGSLIGEREAVVEYSYQPDEPENGVPEQWEILSVRIWYPVIGTYCDQINIAPLITNAGELEIIEAIKSL